MGVQIHPGGQHVPEKYKNELHMCTWVDDYFCMLKTFIKPFSTVGEVSNDGVSEPMAVNPQLVAPPGHRGQQHLTHCSVSHHAI